MLRSVGNSAAICTFGARPRTYSPAVHYHRQYPFHSSLLSCAAAEMRMACCCVWMRTGAAPLRRAPRAPAWFTERMIGQLAAHFGGTPGEWDATGLPAGGDTSRGSSAARRRKVRAKGQLLKCCVQLLLGSKPQLEVTVTASVANAELLKRCADRSHLLCTVYGWKEVGEWMLGYGSCLILLVPLECVLVCACTRSGAHVEQSQGSICIPT
jgi:hypothetical protein